jgi:hypothetical protein
MRSTRLILPALTIGFAVVFAPMPSGAAPAQPGLPDQGNVEIQEVFSPDGTIAKVAVPKPKIQAKAKAAAVAVDSDVVPIQETGGIDERFDLVFIGDGYTEADLALYHQHVLSKWAELSAVEPFKSYKDYFNVWQVNVISDQSGVDDDPKGTLRDTALDMGFYCQGRDQNTERLLCLSNAEAEAYSAAVPGADQVIALGNTKKYGGAGGKYATVAGGNFYAGQIAVHELGHSIGGLADEYSVYSTPYPGAEPKEPNVSKSADGSKWAEYAGQATPDGGVIGSFEGGSLYPTGIYRPSENSIMRTLGREYNLVGRDAMIKAFIAKVPELQTPAP